MAGWWALAERMLDYPYAHILPIAEAAKASIEYHRRRSDTEYPGYIWIEWEPLIAFYDAMEDVGLIDADRGTGV